MKAILITFLLSLSASIFAFPCYETQESKKAIMSEINEFGSINKKYGEEIEEAFNKVQRKSKMDENQLYAYRMKITFDPELFQLEERKRVLTQNMLRLTKGNDCEALKENIKSLKEVTSELKLKALKKIAADT